MKKIFLLIFLALLFLSLIPAQTQAKEPLVPCGPGTAKPVCQLCDFFVLFDNIIDFILIKIVPLVAVVIIIYAAFHFIFSAGSPETLKKARSIMTAVAIGLVIIYAAWLVVGLFFQVIGLADWTEEIYKNWWEGGFFEILCP